VEWSANKYGLSLDMIPRAMPELLKGRALKWFIANNKQWKTWAEFIAEIRVPRETPKMEASTSKFNFKYFHNRL